MHRRAPIKEILEHLEQELNKIENLKDEGLSMTVTSNILYIKKDVRSVCDFKIIYNSTNTRVLKGSMDFGWHSLRKETKENIMDYTINTRLKYELNDDWKEMENETKYSALEN
jgi:hypothetical protein